MEMTAEGMSSAGSCRLSWWGGGSLRRYLKGDGADGGNRDSCRIESSAGVRRTGGHRLGESKLGSPR